MLALVSPGQGAQKPGFLGPWLEDASFAAHLNWLSAVANMDLAEHGTVSDEATIKDTAVAQPLLVAAALATGWAVKDDFFPQADMIAGHSVGEIAAGAGAGAFSPEAAMVLVRERGRAMAEAAAVTKTSMTAVIGGQPDEVLAAIEKHGLTPANHNGKGQIVAAGTVEQLEAFAAEPPARTRLFPLSVAGAFHSVHMEPAVDHLRSVAAAMPTSSSLSTTLLSDLDGAVVTDGRDFADRLVAQVAQPVRWDLVMQTMASRGITGMIELAPAGTLTGIAKRNLKGVELFNLNTPDQLEDARAFAAAHSHKTPETA
ncbi:Malonyl CoA-acyl carrier protein transacylase [Cutibacterium granulosum]|uniref:[acyl-carrier-protein] S-malonyltransferase n=1 Tax=Cutibacterium granulosum TaxID=33011 RepID=A0A239WLU7_9ACTN|nr:ACP S-malonyltransferase [Cutibacterium granulosum]KAG9060089.1 ACP S-malonyltransferase [Cutibacterium granulosum DSM 20700]MDU1580889.1 ACP S-malonyltransferase [Cutibacterium granulosum]SNV34848.1 Malonyl CoA-acyl carrier protein transacylase [Cutibacterium granulosum]